METKSKFENCKELATLELFQRLWQDKALHEVAKLYLEAANDAVSSEGLNRKEHQALVLEYINFVNLKGLKTEEDVLPVICELETFRLYYTLMDEINHNENSALIKLRNNAIELIYGIFVEKSKSTKPMAIDKLAKKSVIALRNKFNELTDEDFTDTFYVPSTDEFIVFICDRLIRVLQNDTMVNAYWRNTAIDAIRMIKAEFNVIIPKERLKYPTVDAGIIELEVKTVDIDTETFVARSVTSDFAIELPFRAMLKSRQLSVVPYLYIEMMACTIDDINHQQRKENRVHMDDIQVNIYQPNKGLVARLSMAHPNIYAASMMQVSIQGEFSSILEEHFVKFTENTVARKIYDDLAPSTIFAIYEDTANVEYILHELNHNKEMAKFYKQFIYKAAKRKKRPVETTLSEHLKGAEFEAILEAIRVWSTRTKTVSTLVDAPQNQTSL